MDVSNARRRLLTRDDLELRGVNASELRRQVASGELCRVHRGRHLPASQWTAAFTEERHLLRVVAVAENMRGSDAVASYVSAGVVWELPLFRIDPARVHLSGAHTSGLVRGSAGVARHGVEVAERDRTSRFGIPCTTLERTVFDVIRGASDETAIACADAALRRVAWDDERRWYDIDAAEEWRSGLCARIDAASGMRGIRRARRIATLADGRAQLPGESVSRLYLLRLGFDVPALQVVIPGPNDEDYRVDFDLARAWGEFDGVGKYTDPAMMREVGYAALADEKAREDWIRGTTGRTFARWGMVHIPNAATLERRLAAFHVFPTHRW
ncbi:MAG: hypothetical protein KKH75_01410 [Actinobacteria bacterium]|nr:hypothetical protein [Actinomycetota bacterium]